MGCVASAVQGTVTRSCRAYARSTRTGSRPSNASRLSSRLASTRLPPDSDTRKSLARSPAALLMKRCSSLRTSRGQLSVPTVYLLSGRLETLPETPNTCKQSTRAQANFAWFFMY